MSDKALEFAAAVKAAFEEGYRAGHAEAKGYRLANEQQNREIDVNWAVSQSRAVSDAHVVEHSQQMKKIRRGVGRTGG